MIRKLDEIVTDTAEVSTKMYDSDDLQSYSSGNKSENDEINQIV
jgi:hypothetical protein